jgi:hypothetical protein
MEKKVSMGVRILACMEWLKDLGKIWFYTINLKYTIVCMIENAFKAILILLDIIIIYHEGTIKNL